MIKWYQRWYYRLMSSRLVRRRYFIYKHRTKERYYVKTTKLFCRTKYIKKILFDNISSTRKLKDAKENFALNSVGEAEQVIQIYGNKYENRYQLPYQRINKI